MYNKLQPTTLSTYYSGIRSQIFIIFNPFELFWKDAHLYVFFKDLIMYKFWESYTKYYELFYSIYK